MGRKRERAEPGLREAGSWDGGKAERELGCSGRNARKEEGNKILLPIFLNTFSNLI